MFTYPVYKLLKITDQSDCFYPFEVADWLILMWPLDADWSTKPYFVVILFPETNVKKREKKVKKDDLAESSKIFSLYGVHGVRPTRRADRCTHLYCPATKPPVTPTEQSEI